MPIFEHDLRASSWREIAVKQCLMENSESPKISTHHARRNSSIDVDDWFVGGAE
jgi:hypothetical protein